MATNRSNDILKLKVEDFFLLKNDIMRQVFEAVSAEELDPVQYDDPKAGGPNPVIRFKSLIEGDKENWNEDFTGALIKNFGNALSGGFVIPRAIIDFINNICIPQYNVNWKYTCITMPSESKYAEAIRRVESFVRFGIPEYLAIALVGCMWNEDNWLPKSTAVCYDGGESFIGLTNRDMKIRIVTRLGLLNRPDMQPYNLGISKLSNDEQMKCVMDYYAHESGACGKWIINCKSDFRSDDDRILACVAAYVSKAGPGDWRPQSINSLLGGLKRRTDAYARLNSYEGFSHGMFMSFALGQVIKMSRSGAGDLKSVMKAVKADLERIFPGLRK